MVKYIKDKKSVKLYGLRAMISLLYMFRRPFGGRSDDSDVDDTKCLTPSENPDSVPKSSVGTDVGATLIELIMVILIVVVIGATVAGVVLHFVQLFMYSPRQLDTQKIGQELSYAMIEGNPDIRGIRYTREVIDASDTQFSYTYGYPTAANQLSVRFRWDSSDDHIYRSTSTNGGSSWSSETTIPYYLENNTTTTIDGKDTAGVIFAYKKAADADWVSGVDSLTDIRRVVISINVKTGTGSFAGFHGSFDFTCSVEIKDFTA